MVIPIATPEQLPIIDISPLYGDSDPAQKSAVAAAMRSACLNTGFFYVSGKRLPHSDGMFKCMKQLFDLPDSSKAKLDANLSPLHRGYTGLGGAHNCVPDESTIKGPDNKESFLLGKQGKGRGGRTRPRQLGAQQIAQRSKVSTNLCCGADCMQDLPVATRQVGT